MSSADSQAGSSLGGGVAVVQAVNVGLSPSKGGGIQHLLESGSTDAVALADKLLTEATTTVSKVGQAWQPWKSSKNKKRACEAVANLDSLRPVLLQLLKVSSEHIQRLEGQVRGLQLEVNHLTADNKEKEQVIDNLKSASGAVGTRHSDSPQVSLNGHENLNNAMASPAIRAHKATLGRHDPALEAEVAQSRFEQLHKEYEKLRAENEKLNGLRADLQKRIKDMGDKAREAQELQEKEARRVKAELRKAADEKAAGIAAAKAEAEKELAVRVREIKALQKKCDAQKTELDMVKGKEYNAKQVADEASLSSVKLGNEVKAANKRAADMKADRDELATQLTQLRQEMGQMSAEFSSVVRSGVLQGYLLSAAPFPRQAHSLKGCPIIHNGSCSSKQEPGRVDVHIIRSAAELEQKVAEGTYVLCDACKAHGF